jgi:hypothetical protein
MVALCSITTGITWSYWFMTFDNVGNSFVDPDRYLDTDWIRIQQMYGSGSDVWIRIQTIN